MPSTGATPVVSRTPRSAQDIKVRYPDIASRVVTSKRKMGYKDYDIIIPGAETKRTGFVWDNRKLAVALSKWPTNAAAMPDTFFEWIVKDLFYDGPKPKNALSTLLDKDRSPRESRLEVSYKTVNAAVRARGLTGDKAYAMVLWLTSALEMAACLIKLHGPFKVRESQRVQDLIGKDDVLREEALKVAHAQVWDLIDMQDLKYVHDNVFKQAGKYVASVIAEPLAAT